ncbi:MAG: hypothetical protein R3C12_24740 [Planctomycetaceae bacterium]|nr:hypothetical protein [Planctomycetaceae bacterium]
MRQRLETYRGEVRQRLESREGPPQRGPVNPQSSDAIPRVDQPRPQRSPQTDRGPGTRGERFPTGESRNLQRPETRGDRGPASGDTRLPSGREPGENQPRLNESRLREGPRSAGDTRQDWREQFRRELGSRTPGGRPPVQRTIPSREYFNRDRDNQSLSYLRLRDPDVVSRIARNPQNPQQWLRTQNYRIRPLSNNWQQTVRYRSGRPIDYVTHGPRIANRLVWWRALQLTGYRWNRTNYVYYDFWRRPLGIYYWNVFRPGARFLVPHYNRFCRGSYVVYSGNYYYYPETYAQSPEVTEPPEPVAMEYGDFAFVRDLAYRFERMTNSICLDLYYNYRSNPEFETVYREAYDLLLAAKEVLQAAERGDQQAAGEWLYGLDQLFYHLLDQVADWERTEQKPIADGDILSKLALAEATLQHLMFDVGVEPSFEIVDETAPLPGPEAGGNPAPMITLPPLDK